MANNQYVVGDVAVRTITFTDATGALITPTTVSVAVTDPTGAVTTYSFPSGALTNLSTGLYQVVFVVGVAGTWLVRWTSTGTGQAASEEYLWVVQSGLARPPMAVLVNRLRQLVGDSGGTAERFTDSQYQSYLDERRLYIHRYPVYFERNLSPTTYSYTTGQVQVPGWFVAGTTGVGGTITDSFGSVVSGWTLDIDGRVTFTADQAGSLRFFTGFRYDLYGAAARSLEDYAAQVMLDFDFETDGQRFSRSQKYKMVLQQAQNFWHQALPVTAEMNRQDTWPMGRQSSTVPPRSGGRFTTPYSEF